MRHRYRMFLAASLGLSACKGTEPFVPTPTSLNVSATAIAFNSLGKSQVVHVTVIDQKGDSIPGSRVVWQSLAPTIASVDDNGRITSLAAGSATIKVSSLTQETVTATVAVSVAQIPATFSKQAGDLQSATVGTFVVQPLKMKLADSNGTGVAGAIVTFLVTQGGGTTSAADTTDGLGIVSTGWQLGTTTGTNTMTATLATIALPTLTFTATGRAGPPVVLTVQAGDSQTSHAGAPVPVAPSVQLHDAFNNPVSGVVVTFGVTAGGGFVAKSAVTTDSTGVAADGWTLGAAGTNTLHASVANAGVTNNPHDFTATAQPGGTPTQALVASGDGQTGLINYALNFAPTLRVLDSANGPVSGVPITFAVTGGGGSITGATTTTDVFGFATVGSWTVQAGVNTLSGTATGAGISGNPVAFTASGVASSFNIDLRYLAPVSAARRAVFDAAAAHWERLIIGDIPDVSITGVPAGQCGANSPPINETVDDVVIFVTLDSIDGPGKILGQSGPCFVRVPGDLPLIGIMHFDTADVEFLENANAFGSVILHEMGHVLGYGVIWGPPPFGLSLLAGSGGNDPHFTGAQALARFDAQGGASYSAGAKVPVENCIGIPNCGAGTINVHWRESVLVNELMTGFLNAGSNPLSAISTASMGDLGYVVNYAGSDPYTVVNPLAAVRGLTQGHATVIDLHDDIARVPIFQVDRTGRVVGVIAPRP